MLAWLPMLRMHLWFAFTKNMYALYAFTIRWIGTKDLGDNVINLDNYKNISKP